MTVVGTLLLLLLQLLGAGASTRPLGGNAVVVGSARFTVITPSLLRLELANAAGQFEDRPSLVMSTLDQLPAEPPRFSVERPSDTSTIITTEHLVLSYSAASGRRRRSEAVPFTVETANTSAALGGFSAAELNITLTVGGEEIVWRPGMKDDKNLNGTLSALDCYKEPTECVHGYRQSYGQGLISRAGWATFDDSATGHWEPEGSIEHSWRWFDSSNSKSPPTQDIYFFGHGHRYKDALKDFMLVAGRPVMPPLSAFGIWWSRYWVYSSKSFTEQVLDGYAQHALPLNHVVMVRAHPHAYNHTYSQALRRMLCSFGALRDPDAWTE
jgi:alpha-glucosidase (family GH31 glycosyl hydrolase)